MERIAFQMATGPSIAEIKAVTRQIKQITEELKEELGQQ